MVVRINRKKALMTAALAAASAMGTRAALGTAYTWTAADAVNNTNWSNGLNWLPAGPPSATADTLTFGDTGLVAAAGNTLDPALTNFQFTQLMYNQNSTSNTYTTSIDRNVTLTLNGGTGGNVDNIASASFVVMPSNAATTNTQTGATLVIQSTGTGTQGGLSITKGNVLISGRPGNATNVDSYAIVDMSGLDSFSYNQGGTNSVFAIGGGNGAQNADNNSYWGKLILGPLTNITTNRLVVGGQNNAGEAVAHGQQPMSILQLGQTTNINSGQPGNPTFAGNIYVGSDATPAKDCSGVMMFRPTGVSSPVVYIGDTASNRNGLNIGRHFFGTGHSVLGVMDLTSASGGTDGTINGGFGTIRIGFGASGGAGGGAGMLSFDQGTVNASGLIAGSNNTDTQNASPNLGIVNVGLKGKGTDAGAGSFISTGNIILGSRPFATNSTANSNIGIINIANTGSVTAERIFLVDSTTSGASAAAGILNLNGGTLTTQQIHKGGDLAQAGTGVQSRLVNFNGGTLVVKSNTTPANAAAYMENLDHATVFAGGATIDTGGIDTVINQPLEAPTGNGVTSISVTDGGAGYRSAPIVLISGGGGTGATAVATLDTSDPNNPGKIGSITITNPGTGYTSAPTVQLLANGGTSLTNELKPYGGTTATLSVGIGALATTGGLTKQGTASLTLNGAATYGGPTSVNAGTLVLGQSLTTSSSVSVADAAVLKLPSNGTFLKVIRTGPVSTAGSGKINMDDNKLITTSPVGTWNGASYTGVTEMIRSGRNGGSWDGGGIVTSQTQATTGNLTSIGVATAQQARLLANPTDTVVFAGQTVTGSDTLVMYTYGGDANLDGKLNVDDYGRIDSNIGLGTAGWYNGDFNYDGKVNVDDYGILDSNIGIQGAQFPTAAGAGAAASALGVTAVPEPASMSLVALAAGALLVGGRRRRREASKVNGNGTGNEGDRVA
jgi:autotransporter-associated beta strand protein